MSLQDLMEQFQVMSECVHIYIAALEIAVSMGQDPAKVIISRRREEDLQRNAARFTEDVEFEVSKRTKLKALEAEIMGRIPSYESRSIGVLNDLKREEEIHSAELQKKHKAELKALRKKHHEETAAIPQLYMRKAAEIEKNLRMDIRWELDLMLEVEQGALENEMLIERQRALETRERQDKIREEARALVDQDLNRQVLATFREEASHRIQPRQDIVAQSSSQQSLKSILKKPLGLSVNGEDTNTSLTTEDETLNDRKFKRVKMEASPRRSRVADILDEEATLFPYRENKSPSVHLQRLPRTPWSPIPVHTLSTYKLFRTSDGSRSSS
ncbi:hypothetical protein VTL71DRAFT_615 [Oculimacula yallundae]|uniref:Uncharacterized protein n=1 Tax=Oculimacula yallundae TaxID=86028 RepID=A0ABR4D0K5_9HELO